MNSVYKVFDDMECPVWVQNKNNSIVYANICFYDNFSLPLDLEYCNIKAFQESNLDFKKALLFLARLRHADVFEYNKKIYKYTLVNKDNEYGHLTSMLVDVTDIYQSNESHTDKNILRIVIDNIPELIFYKDKNLRYLGINKECEKFYNERGVYDIVGKTDLELPLDKFFIEECTRNDLEVLEKKKTMYIEEVVPLPGTSERGVMQTIKTPIINEDGSVDGLVGIVIDVTKQKNLENRLRYLSYTDRLTELYNRTYFDEKIKELKENNQYPIGIITGDVNGLKHVNDYLGHNEGDNLIKQIANILAKACDDKGFVIRWGGDEFITVLPNSSDEQCVNFIKEVNNLCSNVKENIYKLSISQGYCLMTKKININEALRLSDDNMYIEKKKIKYKSKQY